MESVYRHIRPTTFALAILAAVAECSLVGNDGSALMRNGISNLLEEAVSKVVPSVENLKVPVDPKESHIINSTALTGILWIEYYGVHVKHLMMIEGMMAKGATGKEARKRVKQEYGIRKRTLKETWNHFTDEMRALFESGAVSTDYNIIRDHWVTCGMFRVQYVGGTEEKTAICGRNTVLGLPVPCRAAKEGIDFNAIGYFHVPQLYEEPNKYNTGDYSCNPHDVRKSRREAQDMRRKYQKSLMLALGLTGDEEAIRAARFGRLTFSRSLPRKLQSGLKALPSSERFSMGHDDEIFVVSASSGAMECSEEMLMFSCFGTCCNTAYGSSQYDNFCTSHDAYSCISAVPFDI